jgi:hypothetical protein
VPDLATIWRVLTTVDPAAAGRAVGAWVGAQLAARRPAAQVVLAVDGKAVRGARTGDGTAPHLLACLDHGAGVVLAQVAVDGKTNEITVFTALLAQAGDLDGVLHWVRDVTFGEDASTARTGTGPHVMAALRNLVISILRMAGHVSIAVALRHTARDPLRAFRLLTGRK